MPFGETTEQTTFFHGNDLQEVNHRRVRCCCCAATPPIAKAKNLMQPSTESSIRNALGRTPRRRGRLVIVSNRVVMPDETAAGGLGQAMRSLLTERGGLWIGWSGRRTAVQDVHSVHEGKVQYLTLDLPSREFDDYYTGYSNRALWPILHGRADLVAHSVRARRAYASVNGRFADLLAREVTRDDVVWVQDYHLIPLAGLMRQRKLGGRIGFFLHTPMPTGDVFSRMPGHENLLDAFCAYDVIGLQTAADTDALASMLTASGRVVDVGDNEFLTPDGRRIRLEAFPIGIDVEAMEALADVAAVEPSVVALRESMNDRSLMISVDRLDYSKGIPERIEAYGALFKSDPELQRKLTFLQIAPESRTDVPEYRRLSRAVQRRVGQVNGRYGDESWTPLRYVNRAYTQQELAGFYRLAKVGVVTPLRDGMNLVAKEYLACQDPTDPGVLVLSEFAGAARELDSALQVNPLDRDQCVREMQRALGMPLAERTQRWEHAMVAMRARTVHGWGRAFLQVLEPKSAEQTQPIIPLTRRLANLGNRLLAGREHDHVEVPMTGAPSAALACRPE